MARLSVPTSGRLSSRLRVDNSSAIVQKTVGRLSRAGLAALALDWLDDENRGLCPPVLAHDHDPSDFQPPAESIEELRQLYEEMRERKGSRREVMDRIVDGDWRNGLSLYQLAMADMRYLHEHPASQRWAAYRIMPLSTSRDDADGDGRQDVLDAESLDIPRIHPSTFLQKLASQALPDMKVHYHVDRPAGLAMLVVRVFLVDSPYTTTAALGTNSSAQIDVSKTLYIAFPDASPYVYLSRPQAVGAAGGPDAKAFRNLVAQGIPKALSEPRKRYKLKYTDMSTKNLSSLLFTKSNARTVAAGGGWGIYADKQKSESPLDPAPPPAPLSEEEDADARDSRAAQAYGLERSSSKRLRRVARGRFGSAGNMDDGKGFERLDIKMEDPFDSLDASHGAEDDGGAWVPRVKLTFRGPHVVAGTRQLVELGVIDGEKMPGWMTGEEGVTIGAVKDGRIRGHKGSGL